MKKHCIFKRGILAMLPMIFAPLFLLAQNISVTGVVTDEIGEPIAGAMVSVKGGTTAVISGAAGEYNISASANDVLVFSFPRYLAQEVAVNGRNRVNVQMSIDSTILEDVILVGYGTQQRGSITGAVASIKGTDMVKTINENTQNMLTGKLPGVRMWQRSAEPGAYSSNFDIRGYEGGPVLVVIDGVVRTMGDFQRMNAADIEDVSVLKDASAAIYGARSATGVLLVTTKQGKPGRTQVNYSGSFTFQVPSSMPKVANVYDAMTLYNERGRSANNPTINQYSAEDFEAYRNGTRRATDWNSLIFADWSPQTQHNLSITGGTDKLKYYIGLGYSYQEGFFKSGDLDYNKFNVRSNISSEIARGLTFDLNLSGMMDSRHMPWESTQWIIRRYWASGALLDAYADPEQTMLNYKNLNMQQNAVAFMTSDVSGHRIRNNKKFMSSASLNYDFGTLSTALRGLSLKGLFSFDYEVSKNEDYGKEYDLYAYNESDGTYSRALYAESAPSNLRREFFDRNRMLAQMVLNYNRNFGKHNVSGLIGWEVQKDKADNFYAYRDLDFTAPYLMMGSSESQMGGMSNNGDLFYEYAMEGLLGRVNYSYANRYLLEAQFRYDGSSKLAPGYQWHFFPSVSVGWRVSEESFMKNASWSSFIDQLKIRASYGRLGNDNDYYAWLNAYEYPLTGENANNGYFNQKLPGHVVNGVFINGVAVDPLPNISITWATSTTFDIGVDFEAWNGKLGIMFDYFDRRRKGIYERSTADLPTVVGAVAPMLNANSDRQFGMELELSHRNRIGDFNYRIKAMGTITRRMFLTAIQNANYSSSYDQWRNDNLNNRYQGVQFGLVGAGRFESWQDIWNYQGQLSANTIPGDYMYEDWNGDGEIDDRDRHPYAFDQTPWLNYSLSFDASWKNLDLSILFQGSALGSMTYNEPLRAIWGDNGGGALELYLDRWHPADPNADPWNPMTEWIPGNRAYTGRSPDQNSSFSRVSTAYLRLKSLEIGYTLPHIKALNTMNLRVFANAFNLVTITGVKYVDPEHPDSDLGRMYPLNRTFTLGLSLTF